jgi:hypothetical protein
LIFCFFLKGRIKPKKFKTLISVLNEIPTFNNNIAPLDILHPGENENATYRGTVVASLGVQDVKLYKLFLQKKTNFYFFLDIECLY